MALRSRNLRCKVKLAPTEILKEDRGEGAAGKVVILASKESAMPFRKSPRDSQNRIAEFFWTFLASDYQRLYGDQRTPSI